MHTANQYDRPPPSGGAIGAHQVGGFLGRAQAREQQAYADASGTADADRATDACDQRQAGRAELIDRRIALDRRRTRAGTQRAYQVGEAAPVRDVPSCEVGPDDVEILLLV